MYISGLSETVRRVTVMEVIRHAELIVEWFLWTIEYTNRSLDNSNATFRPSRASLGIQCLTKPVTGETLHLNYQVTCWCTRSSKGTILLVRRVLRPLDIKVVFCPLHTLCHQLFAPRTLYQWTNEQEWYVRSPAQIAPKCTLVSLAGA